MCACVRACMLLLCVCVVQASCEMLTQQCGDCTGCLICDEVSTLPYTGEPTTTVRRCVVVCSRLCEGADSCYACVHAVTGVFTRIFRQCSFVSFVQTHVMVHTLAQSHTLLGCLRTQLLHLAFCNFSCVRACLPAFVRRPPACVRQCAALQTTRFRATSKQK